MKSNGEILKRAMSGQPLDHIPVIDFHGHLGSSSASYHIPRNNPPDVVKYMDRYGVDHMVVFSINVNSDTLASSRYHYEAAKEFPVRFSPLTMLHGKFKDDWVHDLEDGYGKGSKGIKLISQYQNIEEDSIDWAPAFEYAKNKKWVALHHDWGKAERLDRWAKEFPEITFIAGHSSLLYRKLLEKYDNVYQCTCACLVPAYACFPSAQELIDNLPPEKILYGSDALDLDLGTGIGPIAFADAPEKLKEDILGGNAIRLMNRLDWNKAVPAKQGKIK